MSVCVQCPQSELDTETVKSILAEYKIHNADVTLRSDATADDLIDVVEGNRYCWLPGFGTHAVCITKKRTVFQVCFPQQLSQQCGINIGISFLKTFFLSSEGSSMLLSGCSNNFFLFARFTSHAFMS